MSNNEEATNTKNEWDTELCKIVGLIKPLECLCPMTWYYRRIRASIGYLAGDEKYANKENLARMTYEQVRYLRRYINTDLHNYSVEFYLQRLSWSEMKNGEKFDQEKFPHWSVAPDKMKKRSGFRRIYTNNDQKYGYGDFLAETLPFFSAIHAHLVSINRALGNLHYYVTELPFATFTDVGRTEIIRLTSELDHLMMGLLVATHLQPRKEHQADLVSYLISCRADCQRLFETIPRYYQSHRIRLIVFPIDPPSPESPPGPHPFPKTCLPGCSGVYLDFLNSYQNIAQHILAVIHWALRLFSLWYFVPRRVLRVISPVLRN